MKIKIELKQNYGRLLNKEPFLLPDILELDFSHVGYDLSNAFLTLKNGSVVEKYKFTKPFIVDKKLLFTGQLTGKLEMYIDGKKVKEWTILPIQIRETEEALIAEDVLSKLENKFKAIEDDYVSKKVFNDLLEKYNTLVDKHNELAETVVQIKENY